MEISTPKPRTALKDIGGIVLFLVLVLIGTLLINSFVFRSFNVEGPSSEPTLITGDRLIINRLPVTWKMLQNKQYIPKRGQFIVFKNPRYQPGSPDEYIVKRVIAFAGERVTVKNGVLTVYNDTHPNGFDPDNDDKNGHPGSPSSGDVDTTVDDGTLFVAGDHRVGSYSYDSRNGLGLIPLYDVVGPVGIRIYPFNKITLF